MEGGERSYFLCVDELSAEQASHSLRINGVNAQVLRQLHALRPPRLHIPRHRFGYRETYSATVALRRKAGNEGVLESDS